MIESLRQQLAERETQVTLLRDGLAMAVSIIGHPDDDGTKHLQKILAATADLRNMRLCYAKPIAHMYQHDETGRTTFLVMPARMKERRWHEIPLYQAWESENEN